MGRERGNTLKSTASAPLADRRSPEFFADRLAASHVVIASVEDDDIGWGSSADAWIIGGDSSWNVVVRLDLETVGLSSPRDATGLFEPMADSQPELLPFEGTGVDTI